jgi:beta-lactamase regulating signal transducer with metallopeptidase domain
MGIIKRIAIAANWWNPLVYIISAEHSISREEVSDNYVLSQLNPKAYSECLVELAERTCLISSLPATVGMADKHISLEQRVKNILSKLMSKVK